MSWVVEKVATHINSFKPILVCNLHWLWGEFVFENYSRVFGSKCPSKGGGGVPQHHPKRFAQQKVSARFFEHHPKGLQNMNVPAMRGGVWFYT